MFVFLARVPGAAGTSAGRGDPRKEPWAQWSVCLRDHVHHMWLCFGLLEQVTAYEQGRVVPDACGAVLVPRERPLAELVGRLDPKMHRSEQRLVVRIVPLLTAHGPEKRARCENWGRSGVHGDDAVVRVGADPEGRIDMSTPGGQMSSDAVRAWLHARLLSAALGR